jgi:hypothetical protein
MQGEKAKWNFAGKIRNLNIKIDSVQIYLLTELFRAELLWADTGRGRDHDPTLNDPGDDCMVRHRPVLAKDQVISTLLG